MLPSCYSKPKNGSQFKMSYTKVIFGVLVVYVVHTCWAIYGFVYTKPCDTSKDNDCITSYLASKPRLQIRIYTTTDPNDVGVHNLLLKVNEFDIHSAFERKVNVSLPELIHRNGTYHAVVFVHKSGLSPRQDSRHVRLVARLTTQMTLQPLLAKPGSGKDKRRGEQRLISFWRSRLTLNIMTELFTFSGAAVPTDLRRYVKTVEDGKRKIYLPLLLVDELRSRTKDLVEINSTTRKVPLSISYNSISLRKFRFWIHVQAIIYSLKHFGFSDQNIDEIKGMFVDSGLHILALSILVPAFHLSFELFTFKNDLSFWRKRKSMGGMSRSSVLWRAFSTIVIFLHLLEEQSSLVVLIPTGISAMIELWKVKRFFSIQTKPQDELERATTEYDSQAMKFLSYLMYPLCISGAVYSVMYLKNKSWFTWLINGLVSGVYAFGFLAMVPQLFVNYKLKSVAHLEMSVFMYKGLNTFMSDVFSGVITTPGPHQLACFRDDVVFLMYLYQRRVYSPNKWRAREYGMAHKKKPKGKPHEE